MNREITGNITRIEIRNCIETELLDMLTFPLNFDLADNRTFQILVQNTTAEQKHEFSTYPVTENAENEQTTDNNKSPSSNSSSEDPRKTSIIFYYLTIGLGSLSGILLVTLIILGVIFR